MINALQGEGIGSAAARAALSFIIAWALLKAGKKRFLKQGSPFDALLAIMTGAVLGRGVTEGEAFYPALAAAAVINPVALDIRQSRVPCSRPVASDRGSPQDPDAGRAS